MSNGYFNHIANVIDAGIRALSAQINNIATEISTGFDKLPTEIQLKEGRTRYAVDTGAADAYVVTLPYVPTLTDGFAASFRATNANAGASTVNYNGTGDKALHGADGSALVLGAIGVDQVVSTVYVSNSDTYQIMSNDIASAVASAASASAASASASAASASASSADADATSTAADVVSTGNDVIATNADVVSTGNDAIAAAASAAAAAADEILTNADAIATAADAVSTGNDATATAADAVSTGNDAIATAADAVSTAADEALTDADATATAADVVSTGLDVGYAGEWANKAEDSLISAAAGGDEVDDYSALHHAAKAAASAASIELLTKVINIGDWDMDANPTRTISHGLTALNIRTISAVIRHDEDTFLVDLNMTNNSGTGNNGAYISGTNVVLTRETSGFFDGVSYNATSFNRGWVTIQYTN